MHYSSRFFLYAPFALLLLLAVLAMVWWDVTATAFDAKLVAANGREIMPGMRLSYLSKSIGGFPFNVDSVLGGLTLQAQMRTGPLVWHVEHFAIHALTYGRNQQIFEAAGAQSLTWTDSDGVHHQFSFVPGSLRASAINANGQLTRFDLDLAALSSPDISAQRLQFHIRRAPLHDALDFVIDAYDLCLKPETRKILARTVSISGAITPAAPLDALLRGHADWRIGAESWRLAGGKVVLDKVSSQQDQITTTASGQLTLDDLHRLRRRLAFSGPPTQIGELFDWFDSSRPLY